eukprot:6910363-Pyramimonas_sp.AAC.2
MSEELVEDVAADAVAVEQPESGIVAQVDEGSVQEIGAEETIAHESDQPQDEDPGQGADETVTTTNDSAPQGETPKVCGPAP